MNDDKKNELTPRRKRFLGYGDAQFTEEEKARMDRLVPPVETEPVQRWVYSKGGFIEVTVDEPIKMTTICSGGKIYRVPASEVDPQPDLPDGSRRRRIRDIEPNF